MSQRIPQLFIGVTKKTLALIQYDLLYLKRYTKLHTLLFVRMRNSYDGAQQNERITG
jgi:hypothetical protein